MKVKIIIGILLMSVSLAGVWFWETRGRDMVLTTEVVVAAENIEKGEVATLKHFKTLSVPKNAVISNSINKAELSSYIGKTFSHGISAKQQISPLDFQKENTPGSDASYFYIPYTWIYSRSLQGSAGKHCGFYIGSSKEYIGSYYVISEEEEGMELFCSLEEYWKLYDSVQVNGLDSLLVVLEE